MTEFIIVGAIVLLAALFVGKRIYGTLKGKSGCGCGDGKGCSASHGGCGCTISEENMRK